MKIILLVFIIVLPFSGFAQDTPDTSVYSSVLRTGETIAFGDRSINFKGVISDSRCPRKVSCVWAGEAKVLVEILKNGKLIEEKIIVIDSANNLLNTSDEDYHYYVLGMDLRPYPTVDKENQPEYTLTVKVVKEVLQQE